MFHLKSIVNRHLIKHAYNYDDIHANDTKSAQNHQSCMLF